MLNGTSEEGDFDSNRVTVLTCSNLLSVLCKYSVGRETGRVDPVSSLRASGALLGAVGSRPSWPPGHDQCALSPKSGVGDSGKN